MLVLLFHVVSQFITSRLGLFFCTTVAWEVAHVLNGVIFLAGNEEARDATIGRVWPRFRKGKVTRISTVTAISLNKN